MSQFTHSFSAIPQAHIPRSSFNRSYSYKTTFNSGKLIPFFVDEALPGDTFNLKANCFARMATPMHPIMDNIYMDTFFFAVPFRLVWDNFKAFMGERKTPDASTDYLIPRVASDNSDHGGGLTGWKSGSVADYFGLPTYVAKLPNVSALYGRAYALVWNEWFRDENLQDPIPVSLADASGNVVTDYDIYRNEPLPRCKRHDYLTSCLPWPQKGPGVELSLGGFAPVIGNGTSLGLTDGTTGVGIFSSPNDSLYYLATNQGAFGSSVGSTISGETHSANNKTLGLSTDPTKSGLIADLSSATAVTINTLYEAFALQSLYQRDARGGTRYIEQIRSHFGVISPDARLQRPEYLGGMSQMININPVVQNSATNSTSPQGNLSAFVVGSSRSGFVKSFTEHTIVIGLVNVRSDITYQQGVDRMWTRRGRFDFYWPTLAHLGEQAVLNREIYAQGHNDLSIPYEENEDMKVFGYQERWAEYRYRRSLVTGKFRSNSPNGSLDSWHLSQDFASLPRLNSEFIQDNPPFKRVIAVPSEPEFLLDVWFDYKAVRPMPTYSVPGLMSRF